MLDTLIQLMQLIDALPADTILTGVLITLLIVMRYDLLNLKQDLMDCIDKRWPNIRDDIGIYKD